jgi:AcrR family transcriptional regulator
VPRPKLHDDTLRGRLLEVAGRIVAEEGAGALSVRRVAADAQTSTTAIYSLFGGKGELVREVWLEGFRRLAVRMEAAPSTGDALDDLRELGMAYHDHAVQNPAFYEIMFGGAVVEYEPSDADRAEAWRTLDMLVGGVRRCVDAGQAAGEPEEIAMVLWGLVHGMASLELHGMLGDPDEARRRFELAMLVSGIGLIPR